ncbi:AsnC family transcriptional regulator [Methanoculleus chikugoensis]|uniref:AsnC family transcriptional regulator n=1 Tax=Methanoculleus chikugoensis TaxID=118126 RepID=UPI001FB41C49|nr:AsnC family transcriptional regulator [Methanoculleus chikugoensis]
MNDRDRALLLRLQDGVPLVSEPYQAIAEDLGMTEAEVIARIGTLLSRGRRPAVRGAARPPEGRYPGQRDGRVAGAARERGAGGGDHGPVPGGDALLRACRYPRQVGVQPLCRPARQASR